MNDKKAMREAMKMAKNKGKSLNTPIVILILKICFHVRPEPD